MKEKIIDLLKTSGDEYISGQYISDLLGITRSAIWKYINILKEEGYIIESVSRKGYRLLESPDILTPDEIKPKLNNKFIGHNIIHFDTIDSTNIKAKELAASGESDGTVVISEEQTAGKGRLGRQWVSPKGKGIWMSIILRPDIDPVHASKVTLIGAAAVFNALKNLNISALIKWPNDLVINNKKACGILTEMSAELNKIHYLIMGIGINVNIDEEDFPSEMRDIATSLKSSFGKIVDRKALIADILNNFELLYTDFIQSSSIESSVEICRKNSIFIGKEVRIIKFDKEVIAKAIDLDSEGQLVIQHSDGKIETVFSGEISMRGLYGYI
jgi:BirA family biotin operon repressor/biotin-[acetyl-CoA-carboxylase] ligase